jgi:hypothetical protein
MPTLLPVDSDNHPIPAMRLKPGKAHEISATGASARNATAFESDTQVVSLYATGPVYVRFGASAVEAADTDHYFPEGVYYDFSVSGGDAKGPRFTHVAVLAAGDNCTVYVSEKE